MCPTTTKDVALFVAAIKVVPEADMILIDQHLELAREVREARKILVVLISGGVCCDCFRLLLLPYPAHGMLYNLLGLST